MKTLLYLCYIMRPKIYSGLKTNNFHDFISQNQNYEQNLLLSNKENIKNFTGKTSYLTIQWYIQGYKVTTTDRPICQGWNYGRWKSKVTDKSTLWKWNNILCRKRILLNNSVNSKERLWQKLKDIRVKYNFNKRPWLQLMCCTLVFGCEVVVYFRVKGSCQRRGPKEVNQESGLDKERVRTR